MPLGVILQYKEWPGKGSQQPAVFFGGGLGMEWGLVRATL